MRPFAEPRLGLLDTAECGVCKGLPQGQGAGADRDRGDAAGLLLGVSLPSLLLHRSPLPGSQKNKDLLWDQGVSGGFLQLPGLWAARGGSSQGLLQHRPPPPHHPSCIQSIPQSDDHALGPARGIRGGFSCAGVCPLACPQLPAAQGGSQPPPAPEGAGRGLAPATPVPVPRALSGQDGWGAAPWSSTWGSAVPCQGTVLSPARCRGGHDGPSSPGVPAPLGSPPSSSSSRAGCSHEARHPQGRTTAVRGSPAPRRAGKGSGMDPALCGHQSHLLFLPPHPTGAFCTQGWPRPQDTGDTRQPSRALLNPGVPQLAVDRSQGRPGQCSGLSEGRWEPHAQQGRQTRGRADPTAGHGDRPPWRRHDPTQRCRAVGAGTCAAGRSPVTSCSQVSAQSPALGRGRGWCRGRPPHLPGVDAEGTEHHAGEVSVEVLGTEGAEVQVTAQHCP